MNYILFVVEVFLLIVFLPLPFVETENADENFCQKFVINKTSCEWKSPPSFPITSNTPCIFSCSYNPKKSPPGPIRVSAHFLSNIFEGNVFISARQSDMLSAWTLPIFFPEQGKNQPFNSIEQIICPPRHKVLDTLFFRVETGTESNVTLNFSLTRAPYIMQLNEMVKVKSTPVSPWFKLYEWGEGIDSVLVAADSVGKTGSNVCAYLSIQNGQCPVGTSEDKILTAKGKYQTFLKNGNMIATKEQFPDGIFIVVLPMPTDFACIGNNYVPGNRTSRSKTTQLRVLIHQTLSGNWYIFFIMLLVISFVVFGSGIVIIYSMKRNLKAHRYHSLDIDGEEEADDEELLNIDQEPSSSTTASRGIRRLLAEGEPLLSTSASRGIRHVLAEGGEIQIEDEDAEYQEIRQESMEEDHPLNSSGTFEKQESEHSQQRILYPLTYTTVNLENSPSEGVLRERRGELSSININRNMNPLNINVVKSVNANRNPRFLYWWKIWAQFEDNEPSARVSEIGFHKNMIISALYIMLPFADILRNYLSDFFYRGLEDKCYFNTKCITSFGKLNDFSRIFTNVAYLFSGICYLVIVRKHRDLTSKIPNAVTLGVNRNYGLFMSLGVGLIIQGIMSSLYHTCPNEVTLRFDMMFMYINAIVLVVGVWSLRHGSVVHHVYSSVGLVGTLLLVAEVQGWVSALLFWVIIALIHLILVVTTSVMLFKFGTWSFSPNSMLTIWREWQPILQNVQNFFNVDTTNTVKPWILLKLFIGVAVNLVIILTGGLMDLKIYKYILIVCVTNMALYVGNYIFTKKLHREKGTLVAWVCLAVSILFWIIALSFYSIQNTDPEATASSSRILNSECILFGVFDTHDLWHLFSALALFYSFVGILTLDDDLVLTNPHKISVF